MTERRLPGRAEWITYTCDEPGCDGEVEFDGKSVLASNPPKYPSSCWTCGRSYVLDRCYPHWEVIRA